MYLLWVIYGFSHRLLYSSGPRDVSGNQFGPTILVGEMQKIPRGWLRRIVTSGSGATLQRNVCYISPAGQKFFSHATLEQHFARLGQSVMSGLFNFEPPQLVDEDEDDEEELEKCSTSSLQQHQQHQQQQQQQHLTSLST